MPILNSLVSIFNGYSFRKRVEASPRGAVGVVQLKDLINDYTAIGDSLTLIQPEGIKSKYYLEEGDVMVVAKGEHNNAVVYNSVLDQAIASSSFFILRAQTNDINPGYLAWYLNAAPAQQEIKSNLRGTYTLNLNRSALEQLPIPLPPVSQQEKIAAVHQLMLREKSLSQQLLEKRQLYVQTILTNSIHTD